MKALIHLSLIQDCGPATVLRLLMALYLREKSSTDQSWEIRKPEMQELVQEAALLKLEQLYAFAHADFLSLGFSEKIATMLYEGLRSTKRLEQELQLAQEHAIRIVTLFYQFQSPRRCSIWQVGTYLVVR